MKILANVKGLGKIVETYSDFHSQLLEFKKAGARLISPRDEAYARLQTRGKQDIGRTYGTRTTGGFEYVKKQLPILKIKSRLTNPRLAKRAVEANRQGNYFHTDSTKEYEESLKQSEKDKNKDPVKRNTIILPSRDNFTISDKENWEIYQSILKDQAKPYFELNGPITVYLVNKKTVDSQNGTLLTYRWFGCLDAGSGFGGYGRGLHYGSRARGVLKSAEGTSQKFTRENLPYTQRQLDKHLKILDRIKSGKIKISNLESEVEKVAEFLQRLKQ